MKRLSTRVSAERDGGMVTVHREPEGAADSRYAVDNISPVNGGGVPGICGNMDGFDCDFGVAKAFGSCNGDSFVEEVEEALDGDGLVVVAQSRLAG